MSERHAPWWLVGGSERCPICLQWYALEAEARCVGCDRGFCAQCFRHVALQEEVWCPECAAEAEPAREADARSRVAGSR